MNENLENLKACPFCGSKGFDLLSFYPYNGDVGEPELFSIRCHGCGCNIKDYSAEACANKWNRRADNEQREGEWEIVIGSNGKEKMVCTNCRHQQDLHSTFTYCPNCGARMYGTKRKGGAE